MSSSTKKKHVMAEVLGEFELPKENESIVRILGGRGNNLHLVEDAFGGEQFLVSMPKKFRRSVWVKRGDFVMVSPIEEGDKVKAEIVRVLYKEQIKYIKEEGSWPAGFNEEEEKAGGEKEKLEEAAEKNSSDSEEEEDDSDLFVNTNRPNVTYEESEESTDESEEESDEDLEENEEQIRTMSSS